MSNDLSPLSRMGQALQNFVDQASILAQSLHNEVKEIGQRAIDSMQDTHESYHESHHHASMHSPHSRHKHEPSSNKPEPPSLPENHPQNTQKHQEKSSAHSQSGKSFSAPLPTLGPVPPQPSPKDSEEPAPAGAKSKGEFSQDQNPESDKSDFHEMAEKLLKGFLLNEFSTLMKSPPLKLSFDSPPPQTDMPNTRSPSKDEGKEKGNDSASSFKQQEKNPQRRESSRTGNQKENAPPVQEMHLKNAVVSRRGGNETDVLKNLNPNIDVREKRDSEALSQKGKAPSLLAVKYFSSQRLQKKGAQSEHHSETSQHQHKKIEEHSKGEFKQTSLYHGNKTFEGAAQYSSQAGQIFPGQSGLLPTAQFADGALQPEINSNPCDPAKLALHPNMEVQEKLAAVGGYKPPQLRRDANFGQAVSQRSEDQNLQKREEERITPVLPYPIDIPVSKDNILKELVEEKALNLQSDDAFKLTDLLLMILSGVLCGARTSQDVERFLESKEAFFKTWLGLKTQIPSRRLVQNVLNCIHPKSLNDALLLSTGRTKHLSGLDNVYIWESPSGIVLGEMSDYKDSKTRSALPVEVLNHFNLSGSVVAVYAHGRPDLITKFLRNKKAEYIIGLNGRQSPACRECFNFFEGKFKEEKEEIPHDVFRQVIEESGKGGLYEFYVTDYLGWLSNRLEWQDLHSAAELSAELISRQRLLMEKRYFLSSLPMDAVLFCRYLRWHSNLENRVEWYADLYLNKGSEDNLWENLEQMRLFSEDLLSLDNTLQISHDGKRKKALHDQDYMIHLLGLVVN